MRFSKVRPARYLKDRAVTIISTLPFKPILVNFPHMNPAFEPDGKNIPVFGNVDFFTFQSLNA